MNLRLRSSLSLAVLSWAMLLTSSPLSRASPSEPTRPGEPDQALNKTSVQPVAKKIDPPVRDINTSTPFVVAGSFTHLPEVKMEKIRFFEGETDFRGFVGAEHQTVWPIGKFASDARPQDEAKFREVLRAHAAGIGADYVVVVTAPGELTRSFPPRLNRLVFGAIAYRRVSARLGVDLDEPAPGEKILRIKGFPRGSLAEAAGLRVGDILKKVDGTFAGTGSNYWSKAVRWLPGQSVKVQVERDGAAMEFEVVLVEA